jgi:uncharacterized protein affecting Mg2+/Co2+ transport
MPLTTHDIIAQLVNEAATVDIYPPERSVLHPVLIRRGFKNKTSERFTFANGDIGIMHVYAFKTREVRFTMSRLLGMKHWISVDTTGEMSSVEGTGVVSLDRHLAQLNFEEYDVDTSTGETAAAVNDTAGANDMDQSAETQQEAIQSPNTSGQGKDPNASKNPYDATLTKAGYAYSHSVPVTMGQEKGTHHTYKNAKTGRSIGVWKQGADWKWDGKTSTSSNVSTQGRDPQSLQRHLSWQR